MEQIKKVKYEIGDNIMSIIQDSLYECYNGKVDFTGPDPKTYVTVETGLGGIMLVNRGVKEMAITSGLVINATDVGSIVTSSKDDTVGMAYTSYTIPFLANVRFVLTPSLDPVEDIDKTNPFINGFRISSYTYKIIMDDKLVVEISCIGALLVFKDELLKLVRASKIADKYEMYPTKVVKYIMNALKTLE